MSGKVFIDTNVWVYIVDRNDSKRRQIARNLTKKILNDGFAVVSTQVIQEFYNISTKKLGIDPLIAKRAIELLEQIEVAQVSLAMIYEAIDCSILSKISFWDALIVISAKHAGCRTLYSEDLSNRQIISGIKVVNPFLT